MKLKQILDEIRKRLDKIEDDALIVFHYDIDGVSSASIVWRVLKKKMIHAKFEPITNGWEKIVIEKIKKHNPRQIVFLDYTPNEDMVREIKDYNVVIIDHHEEQKIPKNLDYFTSAKIEKGYAISYLICKTAKKFYDIDCNWIGFVGSYWDHCLEKTEWKEDYEKLIDKLIPLNLVVTFTRIKGSIRMLKIFNESSSLEEALKKTKELDDYKKAWKVFKDEIRSFKEIKRDGVGIIYLKTKFKHIRVFVDYFTFKSKKTYVFVLKEKNRTKFSFRSNKKIFWILKKIEREVPNFSGGGHDYACGGILRDDKEEIVIEKFVKYFKSHE